MSRVCPLCGVSLLTGKCTITGRARSYRRANRRSVIPKALLSRCSSQLQAHPTITNRQQSCFQKHHAKNVNKCFALGERFSAASVPCRVTVFVPERAATPLLTANLAAATLYLVSLRKFCQNSVARARESFPSAVIHSDTGQYIHARALNMQLLAMVLELRTRFFRRLDFSD